MNTVGLSINYATKIINLTLYHNMVRY